MTQMTIRNQSAVEHALLEFLARHDQPVRAMDTYEPLASLLDLTVAERQQQLSSSPRPAWRNLVQWARNGLKKRGLLEKTAKGFWGLNDAGRQLAERHREDTVILSSDFLIDGAEVDIGAAEGRRVLRAHLVRERSKTLIEAFKANLTDLTCQACGFDFDAVYGEIGKGYIEAHHTVQVASLMPGARTRLEDLIALCANCHRVVHRNGLMTVESLRAALRRNR
jgi:predicted HNH restriction endonuclease